MKKFIKLDNESTNLEIIRRCIPQSFILRPLLFLIFVNDFQESANFLYPLMFADDTNLFYSKKELNEISEWFRANKIYINTGKTKYIYF